MRGQQDLDFDTARGKQCRSKLKFTNPFNPEPAPSPEHQAPTHRSYGNDLTPASVHPSDLVLSDEASVCSDGDSVIIPI